MPVKGIISGVYGSQRILNGKPKWPHYGIDIAAKKGTKIKSSATGVVTMAELIYIIQVEQSLWIMVMVFQQSIHI